MSEWADRLRHDPPNQSVTAPDSPLRVERAYEARLNRTTRLETVPSITAKHAAPTKTPMVIKADHPPEHRNQTFNTLTATSQLRDDTPFFAAVTGTRRTRLPSTGESTSSTEDQHDSKNSDTDSDAPPNNAKATLPGEFANFRDL